MPSTTMSDEQRRPRDPLGAVHVVHVEVARTPLRPCRTRPSGTSTAGSPRRARCRSRRSPCRCGTSRACRAPPEPSAPGCRPTGSRGTRPRTRRGRGGRATPSRRTRGSTPCAGPGEQAAEPAELAGVVALLHRPGDEEEHAGDETVRDHPEDRGVDAEVGERGDAEHHEAHVRDRGERDQALHVRLRETARARRR